MMTSQQLAAELKRIATTQVSDITRAVKEGQKTIALNEVRDMARRLGVLADAFDPRSAESKSTESKSTESKSTESKSAEARAPEPMAAEVLDPGPSALVATRAA